VAWRAGTPIARRQANRFSVTLCDDGLAQVEVAIQRRNPAMRRAVLKRQHAPQRPACPLLAVRPRSPSTPTAFAASPTPEQAANMADDSCIADTMRDSR